MENQSDSVTRYDEAQVLKIERDKVSQRRKAAGFPGASKSDSETGESISVDDQCVGLALSGGGVRSAAFSLGLLQAFHKYGVLRFVDFLSAVSGGTYAAAMLTNSVPVNDDYSQETFQLGQEKTGQQSERIREVSQRTNFLYRADIFLSRFIPNLLLNLAPRIAVIIAIGAGLAFLWRCLDFHIIRDHFDAMGMRNDYAPAIAPAILIGMFWATAYLVGVIVESVVLLRVATRLMWLTAACTAIGCAVLIGNGDVSLGTQAVSGNDGERISWLNRFSSIFVTLVGIGCLPYLAPRKLLKSGVAPESLTQSWIFYYASLALFLGVPLVSIGWFSRENISSFNNARGSEVLLGDLRDRDGFVDLAAGELDGHVIEFSDLSLVARIKMRKNSNTPIPSEHYRSIVNVFEKANHATDKLSVGKVFPEDLQRFEDRRAGAYLDANNRSLNEWTLWRYLRPVTHGIPNFGQYVLSGDIFYWDPQFENLKSNYGKSIQLARNRREALQDLLRPFNRDLNHRLFFEFNTTSKDSPQDKPGGDKWAVLSTLNSILRGQGSLLYSSTESPQTSIKFSNSELPNSLVEQLRLIAANIDEWKTPDDAEFLHPHQDNFASINRALLERVFPNIIRNRMEVRRGILVDYDQRHRLIWFCASLLIALGMSWFVNPNKTGLHGYYRDRLAATYFPEDVARGFSTHPDEDTLTLYKTTTEKQGLPYLLFNASTPTESHWQIADQLETPFETFLLSQAFIGNEKLGYIETSTLRKECPSVADTMAISGAAINPAYFVQHIVSLIMNIVNLRTGRYLPNPKMMGKLPTRTSMLKEFWQGWTRSPEQMSNVLLTDGGYVENLGIESLLKRKCRLIFVCDAGHDPEHHFDDFNKVLRRLQSHYGIRVSEFVPEETKIDEQSEILAQESPGRIAANFAQPVLSGKENDKDRQEKLRGLVEQPTKRKHFFIARILYSECGEELADGKTENPEKEGLLVYIKPSLTGDEGLRLLSFARRSLHFPHEPTQDQSYSESQFDAYLQLGCHAAADVCRNLRSSQQGSTLWDSEINAGADILKEKLFPTLLPSQEECSLEEIEKEVEEFSEATEERQIELLKRFENYGPRLGLAAFHIAQQQSAFKKPFIQLERFAWDWNETSVPSICLIFESKAKLAKKLLAADWLEILQLNGVKLSKAFASIEKELLLAKHNKQLVSRLIKILEQEVYLHPSMKESYHSLLKNIMENSRDEKNKAVAEKLLRPVSH